MKKTVLFIRAATLSPLALDAADVTNLIQNPGFENVTEVALGLDAYYQKMQSDGCDLAEGPVAILPKEWVAQASSGKIRIVEGKAGKEVHSGLRCLQVQTLAGEICFYQESSGKPGPAYHFSFYGRGNGEVYIRAYEYGAEPGHGPVATPVVSTFTLTPEWQKFEGKYQCATPGAEKFSFVFGVKPKSEAFLDDFELSGE